MLRLKIIATVCYTPLDSVDGGFFDRTMRSGGDAASPSRHRHSLLRSRRWGIFRGPVSIVAMTSTWFVVEPDAILVTLKAAAYQYGMHCMAILLHRLDCKIV